MNELAATVDEVDIVWIRSGNSTHSTTVRLTKALSTHELDAIVGSSGRCTIQLELAAAWAIPVFTSVSAILPC
mgnify:CR=1